jgi:hypothetical protein
MDIGLRLAPDRPWSSWTVYLDLHLAGAKTTDPASEPVPPDTAEPDVAVELGAEEFSRVVGGLVYALLREVVDRVLPGDSGS